MKYMILIHSNPRSREIWERFSEEQRAAGLQDYAALTEDLTSSGELVVSEALADPAMGRRVTVQDGRTMTGDGPFAESKEHLAGFFLIECDSMERALEVAARVPEATLGLVEVRPTMVYSELEM
jgi:hypothetical protein